MEESSEITNSTALRRRASLLSERLSEEKLAEIRCLSPAQRLALALQLSDACYELQRACSPKP